MPPKKGRKRKCSEKNSNSTSCATKDEGPKEKIKPTFGKLKTSTAFSQCEPEVTKLVVEKENCNPNEPSDSPGRVDSVVNQDAPHRCHSNLIPEENDAEHALKGTVNLTPIALSKEEIVSASEQLDIWNTKIENDTISVKDGELQTSVKDGELQTSVKDGELQTSVKDGELQTSVRDGELLTSVKDGELQTSVKDGELQTSVKDGELQISVKDGELQTSVKDGEDEVQSSEMNTEVVGDKIDTENKNGTGPGTVESVDWMSKESNERSGINEKSIYSSQRLTQDYIKGSSSQEPVKGTLETPIEPSDFEKNERDEVGVKCHKSVIFPEEVASCIDNVAGSSFVKRQHKFIDCEVFAEITEQILSQVVEKRPHTDSSYDKELLISTPPNSPEVISVEGVELIPPLLESNNNGLTECVMKPKENILSGIMEDSLANTMTAVIESKREDSNNDNSAPNESVINNIISPIVEPIDINTGPDICNESIRNYKMVTDGDGTDESLVNTDECVVKINTSLNEDVKTDTIVNDGVELAKNDVVQTDTMLMDIFVKSDDILNDTIMNANTIVNGDAMDTNEHIVNAQTEVDTLSSATKQEEIVQEACESSLTNAENFECGSQQISGQLGSFKRTKDCNDNACDVDLTDSQICQFQEDMNEYEEHSVKATDRQSKTVSQQQTSKPFTDLDMQRAQSAGSALVRRITSQVMSINATLVRYKREIELAKQRHTQVLNQFR